MSNLSVIGFDPGRTTGVCLIEGVNFLTREFTPAYSAELKWEDRLNVRWALQRLRADEDKGRIYLAAIVIEEFRLFPGKALDQAYSEFPSVRLIGIIEAYAAIYDFTDRIKYQQPAQRKSAIIPDKHKPLLLMSSPHCRDAYQHCRYYVYMHKARRKPPKR